MLYAEVKYCQVVLCPDIRFRIAEYPILKIDHVIRQCVPVLNIARYDVLPIRSAYRGASKFVAQP